MIAKRIIPCLDIKDGRVVKGINFVGLRDAGDPVELAKLYDRQHADELVFLDITASSDKRDIVLDLVERVAKEVFIPFTVGGGIRTIEDMRSLLNAGAEKISINTAALLRPELLTEGAQMFGSQCIVLAVDTRRRDPFNKQSGDTPIPNILRDCQVDHASQYEVYSHGGRTPTGIDALKWIKKAQRLGAGEVLLTSMDTDGTQNGYDVSLTTAIKKEVSIPIVASGGAGTLEHISQILEIADAALLASLLHYGTLSIPEIKRHLQSKNIPVRL